MKHSDSNYDTNSTILALILTLALASIYYSPERFEDTSFLIKLAPIEFGN